MKHWKCWVQVWTLACNYFLTRTRSQQGVMVAQVAAVLTAAMLFGFLRLSQMKTKAPLVDHKPVPTLWSYGQGNTIHQLRIGYAPNTEAITDIVEKIQDRFEADFPKVNISFQGFATEAHLVESHCYQRSVMDMALSFRDGRSPGTDVSTCQGSDSSYTWNLTESTNDKLPRNLQVVIRPSVELASPGGWFTDAMLPSNQWYCESNALKSYSSTGLIVLLQLVVETIIANTSCTMPKYSLSTRAIECQQDDIDYLQKPLRYVLPVVWSAIYLPCAVFVARKIAEQRKTHMWSTLRLFGVHQSVYSVCWGLCIVLEVLLLAALSIAFLFMPGGLAALPKSDPSLVFVLIVSYGLSVVSLSVWLTDWITSDDNLIVAIVIVHAAQTFLAVHTSFLQTKMSVQQLFLLMFLSNFVLDQACAVLTQHETTDEGVHWSTIMSPPVRDNNLSLGACIFILVLNTCASLLARLACRWAGNLHGCLVNTCPSRMTRFLGLTAASSANKRKPLVSTNFVEIDDSLTVFLDYESEAKWFRSLRHCNTLHFKVFSNKTTVLLGHPDSDYSQLIQVLSGQVRASSDLTSVLGAPLDEYLKGNCRFIGVCGQQQAVFGDLSVEENLLLFAQLRCVFKNHLPTEAQRLVRHFSLLSILHDKAKDLSVFWSRVLKLAVASIGHPQMLFIEDPMRDLDKVRAKLMLRLLTKHLSGRTCVLTSTSSETAFQLADKVAVVVDNVTVCFGSKDYINHCFGTGYRLESTLSPDCHADALINYMQVFVPNLLVLAQSPLRLICLLPQQSRHKFEFLLANLYAKDDMFGISGMHINDVRLDDMLLKIRAYPSARFHLLEVEKYRSSTEVFSLKTPPPHKSWPRIFDLAMAMSARTNNLKQHSFTNLALCNADGSSLASLRDESLLHKFLLKLQQINYLSFLQAPGTKHNSNASTTSA